jgi:hypothetical protein
MYIHFLEETFGGHETDYHEGANRRHMPEIEGGMGEASRCKNEK